MKKVAFVLEKDDPRLPIHENSIDGYNQKKIKALTTKNLFSKTSTKKSVMEEGCLSIPKQFADIERPENITIEYLNEKNEKIKEKKQGYEARILQHEIDHLNGVLFVDHISRLKRDIILRKVKKQIRENEK